MMVLLLKPTKINTEIKNCTLSTRPMMLRIQAQTHTKTSINIMEIFNNLGNIYTFESEDYYSPDPQAHSGAKKMIVI